MAEGELRKPGNNRDLWIAVGVSLFVAIRNPRGRVAITTAPFCSVSKKQA
jgi:hypothetical protein